MTKKMETNESSETKKKGIVYVMAFGGLLFWVLAWRNAEPNSGWLSVLLFLPVLAQIIGGFLHYVRKDGDADKDLKFFNFSMVVSTIFLTAYCILWMFYSNGFKTHRVFSWLALIAVVGVFGVVGFMMCAFLQTHTEEKYPFLVALKKGAVANPLWALSFLFFVIFLNVTFLFGFAFAFHDQNSISLQSDAPALRMLCLPSSEDKKPSPKADVVPAGPCDEEPGVGASNPSGANGSGAGVSTAIVRSDPYFFYFSSGRAHLELVGRDEEIKNDIPTVGNRNVPAHPNSSAEISFTEDQINSKCMVKPGDMSPPPRNIWVFKPFNLNNLCSLTLLNRRIERETLGGQRVRIELVGRADDQPITGGKRTNSNEEEHYNSNYELSEARVQAMRYEITAGLKNKDNIEGWHNLEWLTLSASNEKHVRDTDLEKIINDQSVRPDGANEHANDQNRRVVIATVVSIPNDLSTLQMGQLRRRQFRVMNLMDYMYFSIYTITTTGYGDIVPTTGYAKFVISIANICEVLFLVVFFNALVSIRSDKNGENKEKPGKDAASETKAEGEVAKADKPPTANDADNPDDLPER